MYHPCLKELSRVGQFDTGKQLLLQNRNRDSDEGFFFFFFNSIFHIYLNFMFSKEIRL